LLDEPWVKQNYKLDIGASTEILRSLYKSSKIINQKNQQEEEEEVF